MNSHTNNINAPDYMFNALSAKNGCVAWIKDWFEQNGKDCKAIIGVSGGTDSSVVAALCVEALGKDRVVGVVMPNGKQNDIDYAYELCNFLDIKSVEVNINDAYKAILNNIRCLEDDKLNNETIIISEQTKINLPPRIRMATLYAVSQSLNGRVANTCNASEDYVGYSTRYGDSVGDFSPLTFFTKTEVKEIGRQMLPNKFVEKTPSDGLCGKTDEENLGFSYATLDKYIRTGICEDEKLKKEIDTKHNKNLFKLQPMPFYNPLM